MAEILTDAESASIFIVPFMQPDPWPYGDDGELLKPPPPPLPFNPILSEADQSDGPIPIEGWVDPPNPYCNPSLAPNFIKAMIIPDFVRDLDDLFFYHSGNTVWVKGNVSALFGMSVSYITEDLEMHTVASSLSSLAKNFPSTAELVKFVAPKEQFLRPMIKIHFDRGESVWLELNIVYDWASQNKILRELTHRSN